MNPNKKKFDCVDMKHSIQEDLLKEYENQKEIYKNYAEFIKKTTENDPIIQEFRKRMNKKSA